MRLKVVVQNCSEEPLRPDTWLSEGYPIRFGDPSRAYAVRGTGAHARVEGWLGPEVCPNAEERAPYRPLDVRGFDLESRDPIVAELEIVEEAGAEGAARAPGTEEDLADPVALQAADEVSTIVGSSEGFFFGRHLFQASSWSPDLISPGRVIWRAEGIVPSYESAVHAAPRCIVWMTFRPESPIVEIALAVETSYDFARGTFRRVRIPPLSWRTAGVPFVDWCVERGGGEVVQVDGEVGGERGVLLQPEFYLGAGQRVEFLGALLLPSATPDLAAWRTRVSGGAELLAHADAQRGNLPPYGSLGGSLHPNDDAGEEIGRVEGAFERLLERHRREVAAGGFGTRSTFSDPGVHEPFSTVCRANPSGQGWQGGFGHTTAALTYADGVGVPFTKKILRFFQLWDVQRPIHWVTPFGDRYDPTKRPELGFWMGQPHPDPNACPNPLGLPERGSRYENEKARFRAGGMLGFDAQHWSVLSLAQLYTHDLHPRLRQHADALVCSYLAERPSGVDPDNPLAGVDATRSWRAERGAATLYALTGDARIPKRFAERLPIYARLGFWDRRDAAIVKSFVPYIEAATKGLSIVRPFIHKAHGSQLMRWHSPEWETMLGIMGACDMARLIRAAGAVLDEDLLRGFEKAIGDHLSQWIAETGFGSGGVRDVTKAIAWPEKQADGWPDKWRDPNDLYDYEAQLARDPSKTYSATDVYADWCLTAISLDARILGRVEVTPQAKTRAEALRLQAEQLFLKTPRRHRLGFMQERTRWTV